MSENRSEVILKISGFFFISDDKNMVVVSHFKCRRCHKRLLRAGQS